MIVSFGHQIIPSENSIVHKEVHLFDMAILVDDRNPVHTVNSIGRISRRLVVHDVFIVEYMRSSSLRSGDVCTQTGHRAGTVLQTRN